MNDQIKHDFMELLSELSIASITINEGNIITCCNNQITKFVQGTEKNEMIGKPLDHFIDDHPVFESIHLLALEMKQGVKSMSCNCENENGLYYIIGKHKDKGHYLFIVQDRTSEREYEQLLLDNQRLESVSHLSAGVAHELRNPMSVIQGFIQLSSMTGDLSRYYETIMTEISRMNHFIDDFLSISRKKISKTRVLPKDFLESVLKLIESECLLHGITFDYQFFNVDDYICINEGMLKQVLLNLLRNSIEAYDGSESERRFRLHAYKDGNQFVLFIEDFGSGMNEEVVAKLGKPFFTTKEKGTGIGIPLCQKIIKDHGGRFNIESQLGEGTKITIMLPFEND